MAPFSASADGAFADGAFADGGAAALGGASAEHASAAAAGAALASAAGAGVSPSPASSAEVRRLGLGLELGLGLGIGLGLGCCYATIAGVVCRGQAALQRDERRLQVGPEHDRRRLGRRASQMAVEDLRCTTRYMVRTARPRRVRVPVRTVRGAQEQAALRLR